MRFKNLFLIAATLLSLPIAVSASGFNRNAANIEWRTAETEHFRFRYPKELEGIAGYIAGIAEDRYNDKVARYHMKMPSKIEFIIRDDIFSNGWANSLENTMNIWVTDWDFPIRSTHNWLKDVVTHEFSHLVSIQSGSKTPAFIQGLVIGYQDYYNKPVQGDLATIIPFTQQPNWFAEGVAQYESSISGGDAWDSHRDMILRTAVLNGKLLPIERMETFAGSSIEYEQGPYTQGFALVRYICAHYGDSAMINIWADYSHIYRQTMSGAMEHVLGKSDHQIYDEWKAEITAQYTGQVKNLGTQVYGQKLTSKGYYNYYPRWDHKDSGIFYVSNIGRDDFRAGLGHIKLADTTKKEEERFTPVPGVRGEFDVARNDSTFVFASAKETDRDGMHKLDVFQRRALREVPFFESKDPTEKRFTKNLNAVNPNYNRDDSKIVFVRAENGGFRLCVAPVPSGKELDMDSVQTIFPSDSMAAEHIGFNIYTPKFSPDGKKILFSYFDNDSRNIGIVNTDGSGFSSILSRPYDERDPEWSPDGKSFFFSSDSTGIYNIYRYTFGTKAIDELTNVSGSAFSPAVDSSGTKVAYVDYDSNGFSLYLLKDLKPIGQPQPVKDVMHAPSPDIESIELSGKSEPYRAIPTRGIITPIIYGEQLLASNNLARNADTKWLAGVTAYANDPVLKNELSAGLLLQVGNGIDYVGAHPELLSPDQESQFFVGIANHSTPVTLGLNFSRGNLTSSDTVGVKSVNGLDQDSIENQNYALTFRNLEASATYNLFDASAVGEDEKSSYLRVAAGYNWNDFNFYDLGDGNGFDFTYYKSLYASALLSFYGADYSDKDLVAPTGMAAVLGYTYSDNDLIRNGSFQETFTFNANGVVTPIYRNFVIHNLDAGLTYGLPMPWSKHSALVGSAVVSSILDWKNKSADSAGDDTLDSFFKQGIFLRGYPYLRNSEDLAFSGENTAQLSLDLNQPLFSDIYARYWTVFVEDIYVDPFWEAGRAWDGSLADSKLFSPSYWNTSRHPNTGKDPGWYQSAGLSFKINARVYHSYPFLIYAEFSRGLTLVYDDNHAPINTDIKIGSLNTYATQIRFGISFGLYNGLLGGSVRNPMNPRSPFAQR